MNQDHPEDVPDYYYEDGADYYREMAERAKVSPFFKAWIQATLDATMSNEQLLFTTMLLALALHDQCKVLEAKLLDIYREGLPDVVIDGVRFKHTVHE